MKSEYCCIATGVIRVREETVTVLSPHSHPPHKDQEELALYRHMIRKSAKDVSSMVGFRNIFDRESARLVLSRMFVVTGSLPGLVRFVSGINLCSCSVLSVFLWDL